MVKYKNINPNKIKYKKLGNKELPKDNKIKFEKNADDLFYQYRSLRKNIARKYKSYAKNKFDLEDLYSYIDETFIVLCHEYQNYIEEGYEKPIEFAGYISRMLNTRTHGSFLIPNKRKNDREFTLQDSEQSVENIIDEISTHKGLVKLDKTHGNNTQIVDAQPLHATDESGIELADELESMGLYDEIVKELINQLVNEGLQANSAISQTAKKLDIPREIVLNKYQLLYDYLGLSRGII